MNRIKSARAQHVLDNLPVALVLLSPWLVSLWCYGTYYLTGVWPTPFK